ncbi:hypothetical protein ACE939_11920 [Aquimarina sp. W85]|uniref:hypothetical protein n=1 Tax=Aquimarina rhodophyticola TaxID=3342246 RepID=UPI0036711D64
MKTFKFSFLMILCCLQGFSQIYVSPTGDDTTGTGSSTSPYKTIIQAINAVPVGGTVYVASGTYPATGPIYIGKSLTIQKNGSGDAILDASAWTSSDTYVLGIVNTSNVTIDGLTIKNKIGNGSKGIWILANGGATADLSNITIKNSKVTNIGWISNNLSAIPSSSSIVANAIKVDGGNGTYAITNVSIDNNTVNNCATGWGEAITVTGNVDGFAIANNRVFDIANIGIVAAGNYKSTGAEANNQARNGIISQNEVFDCMSAIANSAGIYLDGAKHCKIIRNEVYNCGVGISVGAEENTSINYGGNAIGHIIHNNSIYQNVITGAIFGGAIKSGYSTILQDTQIYNNTFYKNRTGAAVNGVSTINGANVSEIANNFGGEVHLQNSDELTFKNNIVYANTNKKVLLASSGYTISNFESDNNLFYRDGDTNIIIDITGTSFNGYTTKNGSYNLTSFKSTFSLDLNSVEGDPNFTDAAIYDFALTSSSPAVDKGDENYSSELSGTVDFDGDARYRNNRIDIGNSELQIGATNLSTTTLTQSSNKSKPIAVVTNSIQKEIIIDFGNIAKNANVTILNLTGQQLFAKKYSSIQKISIDSSKLGNNAQIVLIKIDIAEKTSYHKIYLK